MATLPTFLEPWGPPSKAGQSFHNAIFHHPEPVGRVHALWWSPILTSTNVSPPKVILFIPGNPGLLHFYVPFLSALHARNAQCAVLAHSHVGHTPGVETTTHPYGLSVQIQGALEAVDAIKAYSPAAQVVVIGHSIGAWITLQLLKSRVQDIAGVFLLFPTISHIASTPNGRKLSWIFPWAKSISRLSYFLRFLPLDYLLSWIYSSWPPAQLTVLKNLLNSPATVHAALSMAHSEMEAVCDLETQVLQQHKDKIWMYFAQMDDWVGDQRELVLRAFEHNEGSIRVAHDHHDIPHAFCINHGDDIAQQCHAWLKRLDA